MIINVVIRMGMNIVISAYIIIKIIAIMDVVMDLYVFHVCYLSKY
jgi:hypothetical protein